MENISETFVKWMKKNCIQHPTQGYFGIGCMGKCCDEWYNSEEARNYLKSIRDIDTTLESCMEKQETSTVNETVCDKISDSTSTVTSSSNTNSTSMSSSSTNSTSSSSASSSEHENISKVTNYDENTQMVPSAPLKETYTLYENIIASRISKKDGKEAEEMITDAPSTLLFPKTDLCMLESNQLKRGVETEADDDIHEMQTIKKRKTEDAAGIIINSGNANANLVIDSFEEKNVGSIAADDDDDDFTDEDFKTLIRFPICRKKKVICETVFFINHTRTKSICVGYNSENNFLPCIVISCAKRGITIPYKDSILLFDVAKDINRALNSGREMSCMLDSVYSRVSAKKDDHIRYVSIVNNTKNQIKLSLDEWYYFITNIECIRSVVNDYYTKSIEVVSLAHELSSQTRNTKLNIPSSWKINSKQLIHEMCVE